MMKNTFYFILKAPFVHKTFKFLPWLFGQVEKNRLIRNIKLMSKFMKTQLASKQLQYSNCPIFHEVKAQPDNEICSASRL